MYTVRVTRYVYAFTVLILHFFVFFFPVIRYLFRLLRFCLGTWSQYTLHRSFNDSLAGWWCIRVVLIWAVILNISTGKNMFLKKTLKIQFFRVVVLARNSTRETHCQYQFFLRPAYAILKHIATRLLNGIKIIRFF